ncbi:hypothetical protein Scep_021604 [Stephania cephalantha]|uniref:Uncharacterized protein n=1 Tax=Stephania cephalantha TaxID=152367 RepID=A0AAP0I1L3_9MAGN
MPTPIPASPSTLTPTSLKVCFPSRSRSLADSFGYGFVRFGSVSRMFNPCDSRVAGLCFVQIEWLMSGFVETLARF